MDNPFAWLLDSASYMPHGHCYLWQPSVLWLHVVADGLIGASYFAIPAILWYFVRRRRNEIPYWWMPVLFAGFIVLCGSTHLLGIWTIWNPDYRLDGAVKLATGLVSAGTAFSLAWIMPQALQLKTPAELQRLVDARTAELESVNRRLEQAIEAQRATEVALRREERRYRLAAQALRGYLYEIDVATGAVVRSPGFETLLGYREDVQTMPSGWWDSRVHPEDWPRIRRLWDEARDSGVGNISCRYRALNAAGQYLWLWDHALFVRDADGRLEQIVGNVIDVSEQEHARQALTEADRRKDEFLATLAHELRNPLAPIRYALRLLEPGTPGPVATDARRMVARQVAHMARLLDDLLDVGRITRGRLELRSDVLDLRTIVHEAADTARPLIEALRHELRVSLPESAAPVRGDPTRLAQIVGNLLHNAAKYTEPGGHIEVAVECDADEVRLCVRDDGTGLAPDELEPIFELFARTDTGKRMQSGLGIGLPLSRQLAQLHGGRLHASSKGRGHGSEFTLALPRTPAPSAAPEAPPAGGAPRQVGRQARLLIVDDNVDAADALARVLALEGYVTRTVNDGVAATEVAELLRPDVVLLDIGLPRLDGHEVARWIRSQPWGVATRLVAITGWGQERDRQRSRDAGFDEHLTKPVDPEQLLQWLANSVAGPAPGVD
ncbi:MAG: ATP-binding protein [Steroidobacteraceae bacterium]|jgi:two-component system CheB/CheR fusion protein|nr:ATP-binding protein [Steroidobacteraceae bacterium]